MQNKNIVYCWGITQIIKYILNFRHSSNSIKLESNITLY